EEIDWAMNLPSSKGGSIADARNTRVRYRIVIEVSRGGLRPRDERTTCPGRLDRKNQLCKGNGMLPVSVDLSVRVRTTSFSGSAWERKAFVTFVTAPWRAFFLALAPFPLSTGRHFLRWSHKG